MLRRLYDWTMRQAAGPQAEKALAVVAFAESSFFPLPPDIMLVPMCLANRQHALRYALVATVASVLGGLLGYAIGYFLIESVGKSILALYAAEGAYEDFHARFAEYGLWIILIKGLTPIPYKVVTIASGAAAFSLPVFIAASIVTRGARFFLVATLLYYFGPPVRHFIEKQLGLVLWGTLAVIVAGFAAAHWLF
jgi:membrane protein YqaA with SNARE-associated domain